MFRGLILACALSLLACEGSVDELSLGQRADPIRNGTREPQTLELSEGQKLAIGWLHSPGRAWQNFCTGTLVAPRVVMTARHCIDGQRQGNVAFGLGLMPNQPFATLDILSTHAHPDRDAAILILTEDALERYDELEPIPINRTPIPREVIGREIEAAGYGETYDRSRSGRYFAAVQLSEVTDREVIVDGRGEQGICFGDSGGPVIMEVETGRPVVLGVESWGDPSCFGVDHLTRLDTLAPWIDEVTAEALRPPDDECEDIPDGGLCDEGVLMRCRNGRYEERNCGEEDLQCRRPDRDTGFVCAERDVCAEVGALGICDGATVVRCRFSQLVTDDCGMRDLVCKTDGSGAFCDEVDEPDPEDNEDETPAEPADADVADQVDPSEGDPGEADSGMSSLAEDPEDLDGRAASGGCASQSVSSPLGSLWLLLLPFLARRRRRR